MQVLLKILLLPVLLYVGVVIYIYAIQGRMLYLPDAAGPSLNVTPASAGLEFDDIRLTADDGVGIHGWYIPGESTRTILFFHGNGGDISHRLQTIQQLHSLGWSIFIIDYRGYGKSGGQTTEQGMYLDATAAWQYLTEKRGLESDDIVVQGRSLGGSVASWLAAEKQPAGLIVESSFTSVVDVARNFYWWLPVELMTRYKHPTQTHVAGVECPILIVHSRDDRLIPYQHGEALFAVASEPKTMLTIRGGHNDSFSMDEENYLRGVRRFLTELPQT